MYRELIAHREYVSAKLEENLSKEQRKQLFKYHVKRVRDFQHERLIHLLVTFFFGALLIGALIAWLYIPAVFSSLFYLLTAILFVLELAYIRHYYQLENGVQSLYELTEKLGKL